jgi:hypothetical protein
MYKKQLRAKVKTINAARNALRPGQNNIIKPADKAFIPV